MYISSSPHETKLAVVEDDQLVEVYFERDTDVGLVGGIYKGRVSRVLPGMQSAFVDIGLDRDAFLYVSDFFFEDQEDYDKILEEAEACAVGFNAEPAQAAPVAAPPIEGATQESTPQGATLVAPVSQIPTAAATNHAPPEGPSVDAPSPETPVAFTKGVTAAAPVSPGPTGEEHEQSHFGPRGRRWRHRGRKFGEHRQGEHKFVPRQEGSAPPVFEILPGESLAKYSHAVPESQESASQERIPAEQETVEGEALEQAEGGDVVETAPTESESLESSEVFPGPTDELGIGSSPEPTVAPVPITAGPAVTPVEESAPPMPPVPSVDSEIRLVDSGDTAIEETGSLSAERIAVEPTEPSDALEATTAVEAVQEISAESAPQAPPPAETAPEPLPHAPDQEMQAPQELSIQAGTSETPGAPNEGTYTLREPHQRPRFAPRRGRRGRRGASYQGRVEPRWESRPGNNQPVQISKLLKEGQEILVQISKEPLGTKGARITSHIALPGRYLVYMPTVEHIGVSRKIASEEERLRLRNIILEHKGSLTGGFIVRTAGQGRDQEELKADLKFLSALWSEIRSKTERAKAPALIHRDLDLVQRVLRDTLTPDFKSVRVDNEIQYERVLDFVNRSQPSLIGKVKLYTRETPMFEGFGIQSEIEKALKPKVWLKSGGYIVINQTEALVAIDVNTGKYVGKTNRLEDTILKTNFDAVNEIVRQIRLRDLGGIIVIDFIDMDERKNRAKVTQTLEEALRKDRAPTKVIAFHDFGLVAITRKRVKQSLERTLCERCSYCSGSGWVKSPTTVCYEILGEARKMAGQIEGNVMTLRVNPEVAKVLKSREGVLLSELESLTHKDVIIKSDPLVDQERFEIF
jgi:ribonuclease G